MTGNINFGKNIHKTFARISYQVADIIMCIEAAVAGFFSGLWFGKIAESTGAFYPPGAHFGEFG